MKDYLYCFFVFSASLIDWLLPQSAFAQSSYSLEVGQEQYLSVPDVPLGIVDHTVWACDNANVVFVEKDNVGAKVKVTSYFDKAATISLIYVAKYYDNKGFTRSYTNIKYYSIQCKSTSATIVPSVLTMKVGDTYQLRVSPSSYQSTAEWDVWTYQGNYVTVNNGGLVEAKNEGMEIVFATLPGSSSPLTSTIYVKSTKLSLRANIASGTISKGEKVSLVADKDNATIYYTLDGTSPEIDGVVYTEPIVINSDVVLKAIAYDNDEEKEPSDILERRFTTENNSTDGLDNVIFVEPTKVFAGDGLTLSIRMKNNAAIRGFQFNLYLPNGVTAAKSTKGKILASLNSNRLDEDDEHTLSVTEQNDGSLLFLCSSLYDEVFIGNDGEIATITLDVSASLNNGEYPIVLKNIKLTENANNKFYEISNFTSTLTVLHYILGDINGDQQVDVSDYIGIANRIHGNTPDNFIEKMADVDGSGVIDVSDYIGVANLIHSGSIYGDALHATIMTYNASSIGDTYATLNGDLFVISATKSYTVGFFVSTNATPSKENYVKTIYVGRDVKDGFTYKVTGLSYNTTYYYCSYIMYDGIYYYGETRSFTTTKKTTFVVGDLYPDNNNPIGVVFYVSNGGKSGKLVSLDQTKGSWFEAIRWPDNYGTGWSQPTKSELQQISSSYSKISNYVSSGYYWSSDKYSSGLLDTKVWVVTLAGSYGYMGYTNGYTFYVSAGRYDNPIGTNGILAVKSF